MYLQRQRFIRGKWVQGSTAINAAGPAQLLVTDDLSGTVFLIDSGAQVSLIPRSSPLATANASRTECQLRAANGSPITTYGTLPATISIAHKRYSNNFIIANVHRPILGADFLRNHGLLVDIRGQRLLEFNIHIQHIAGKDNITADWLSRTTIDSVHLAIDPAALAAAQSTSDDIRAARTAVSSLKLEEVAYPGGLTLVCDTSLGFPRPVVPPEFRRDVFDVLHGLSHPGIRATTQLVQQRYVWHNMKKDVKRWCRECAACAASKVHRHYKAPVGSLPTPERKFSFVHIDITGPLPRSRGFTHLLTIVDRTTRWPEALPLDSTKTEDVARAFISGWISRYGIPLDVTSDRGCQFTSNLWNCIAKSLGSQLHRTTSFHPSSNGLAERWHRSVKASLKARLKGKDWVDQLPWVLLGLRTSPKADLDASVAELMYGTPLLLPGEMVSPASPPAARLPVTTAPRPHGHPCSTDLVPLLRSKFVFVRAGGQLTPLQRPYMGPFRVLEPGPKHFRVLCGAAPQTISVDRLKPAHIPDGANPEPLPYVTRTGRTVRPRLPH